MPALTTRDIADLVHGELRGDATRMIQDVAPLTAATAGDLAYVASDKQLRALATTQAGAVLISRAMAPADTDLARRALILVDDAQRAFISAMLTLRPRPPRRHTGISPRATIASTAAIGPECNVGPGAVIGERVILGARCDVHPGVVIGDGCRIGDDVTLHPNAVLYHDVRIGNRVIIHATAVIGADGFGYRFESGRFQHIPHTGTVVIEDDVEIGAGTTIDRAMIGATLIGEGTKLDNQVMIAHNCVIGKHNAFAAQVGLAGSATTGDYVRCGGQVGVADHAHIGAGCSIGAMAGVSGNVPDGERYHGIPAGPEKEAVKAHLALKKLPEMRNQLRALEAAVRKLEQLVSSAPLDSTSRAA
jgi:UDP-3-O-[3-hydroxymyristoyl] glucosamine N-acyltransferase